MTRRFVHRWMGTWFILQATFTVVFAMLWAWTGSDMFVAAVVTSAHFLIMIAAGWLVTRAP